MLEPQANSNDLAAEAEVLRKMWQHEDTIANHRITWFTTTQGLLFAALALVVKGDFYFLKGVLVVVGIGSCALTFVSLLLGSHAKEKLNNWWHQHQNGYIGPPAVGFYVEPGSLLGYLAPSNLLSILFCGAWLFVAFQVFRG